MKSTENKKLSKDFVWGLATGTNAKFTQHTTPSYSSLLQPHTKPKVHPHPPTELLPSGTPSRTYLTAPKTTSAVTPVQIPSSDGARTSSYSNTTT